MPKSRTEVFNGIKEVVISWCRYLFRISSSSSSDIKRSPSTIGSPVLGSVRTDLMPSKNKDGSGNWPDERHIGWSVATAGRIELDTEYVARSSIPSQILPAGFKLLLKDIDRDGYAWVYHDAYGVLRFHKELLVAWDR